MLSNCILPTHFYNSLINIESIYFLSPFDTHQSHHLLGSHATCMNSLFSFFMSALHFSNLSCQAKKPVLTREKIKRNMLDKKAFLKVIKLTAFL